jgi:hypothetical protein
MEGPMNQERMDALQRLSYFARLGIPVFLDKHGEACLVQESGPGSHPVVVASIPKSGTYLFAELLATLGLRSAGIHIATYGFQDLRFHTKEFIVARSAETFEHAPYDKVLPLVRPGQFVVSHFACEPQIRRQLRPFRVLFTYRNVRDTLVSTMRWVAKKAVLAEAPDGWADLPHGPEKMLRFLHKHGAHYLDQIRRMKDWPQQPGVLSLSFEEIQGDFGAARQIDAVQCLAEFLEQRISPAEAEHVLQRTLGTETLTYSGQRSERWEVWSDEVEDFFRVHGVDELEQGWYRPHRRRFAFSHRARTFSAEELAPFAA